jgi:hypothetical protein
VPQRNAKIQRLPHLDLRQQLDSNLANYPSITRRVLVENAEKLAVASSVLALHVAVHEEMAAGSRSDTIIKVWEAATTVQPRRLLAPRS